MVVSPSCWISCCPLWRRGQVDLLPPDTCETRDFNNPGLLHYNARHCFAIPTTLCSPSSLHEELRGLAVLPWFL